MPFLPGPISGYSTQAQVSLVVAEIINNGRLRFWFAADFNPLENAPTSNPLRLYEELDRAAKKHDIHSDKTSSVGDNLRAWVHRWQADGLIDREAQAHALFAIRMALDEGGFRPVVFFLEGLMGVMREAEPDEYRVENQPIEAPNVRRIVPAQKVGHSE